MNVTESYNIGVSMYNSILSAYRAAHGDKIVGYPLLAPEGADKFPFFVYDYSPSYEASTKDGGWDMSADVKVVVIAKRWAEAMGVAANMCEYAMQYFSSNNIDVTRYSMTSAYEDAIDCATVTIDIIIEDFIDNI